MCFAAAAYVLEDHRRNRIGQANRGENCIACIASVDLRLRYDSRSGTQSVGGAVKQCYSDMASGLSLHRPVVQMVAASKTRTHIK